MPIINRVPTYLKAIGYSPREGSKFRQLPLWAGNIYSNNMPSVPVAHCESCTIRFPRSVYILTPAIKELEVHAILFHRGYVWDAANGWRSHKIPDNEFDEIKIDLFFNRYT